MRKAYVIVANMQTVLCTCDTEEKAKLVISALGWMESETGFKFMGLGIETYRIFELPREMVEYKNINVKITAGKACRSLK